MLDVVGRQRSLRWFSHRRKAQVPLVQKPREKHVIMSLSSNFTLISCFLEGFVRRETRACLRCHSPIGLARRRGCGWTRVQGRPVPVLEQPGVPYRDPCRFILLLLLLRTSELSCRIFVPLLYSTGSPGPQETTAGLCNVPTL